MTVNEGLFVSRVNFLNTLSNYIRFDEITISKFFLKFIAFFLLTIVLSGCAGKRAFNAGNSLLDDGKPVEGLAIGACADLGEEGRNGGADFFSILVVVATDLDERLAGLGHFRHDHGVGQR